jgi:hypothetical protein
MTIPEDTESLIYQPPYDGPKAAENINLGVKFANDIFLHESFLKQRNIKYEQSDLERTPMGMCYRIKRDSNGRILQEAK